VPETFKYLASAIVGAEQPVNPPNAISNDANKNKVLIFRLLFPAQNFATKKDQRKGWPSLGRTHNAVQHCAIRQKRQLCVRFKVIYCLAVATLTKHLVA